WNVPDFAHIPLIHGPDGSKLSKRHGATSVIEYKEMGYLPEAMRNYLLRLGWSHGDAEIISDAQAIEWFDLDRVGKSPARFDFTKLRSVNKHYIKEKSEEELLKIVGKSGEKMLRAVKFIKERAELLTDLTKNLEVYCDGFAADLGTPEKKLIAEKQLLLLELQKLFTDLNDWSHAGIKNSLNEFAAVRGLKIKDFGLLLRIVLTYSSASPGGIFDVIEILGKDKVIRRLEPAILS
ncbi:MAG: glutamate--tRNA ligase, partial [Alphaproteobacteria bacterium]|nr:glutamate--tRNA ligase [Alphaproteobacteria bacterium]